MGVSSKIIAHSKFNNTELITMEIEFHRFILSEINTHRVFSRNYQSSRAVPIQKMIDQVKTDPAIPVHWGKTQRGMVAEAELDGVSRECVEDMWLAAAESATISAQYMNDKGCHKQVVNRVLEPFVWTKGVVTATKDGFESFFKLRSHPDAQPEIRLLSDSMKESLQNSTADILSEGEWHLPYVKDGLGVSLEDKIKISASSCAQVSYRTLDTSLDKAKKIYDMLNLPERGVYKEDPPHFSPCEHIARATNNSFIVVEESPSRYIRQTITSYDSSGNFNTKDFTQYRKLLEKGDEILFL